MQITQHVVIGLCGFAGPPDSDGIVEIAYSISPDYQGRGFATRQPWSILRQVAAGSEPFAHTLPELNASTRVLEKCGFRKTGEMLDSENALVWRWEKTLPRSTSNN